MTSIDVSIAVNAIAGFATTTMNMIIISSVSNAVSIVAMIVDYKDTDRDSRIAQNVSNESPLYEWENCKKKMKS